MTDLSTLDMLLDWRLPGVMVCVFVGGFIRGFAGFGSAMAIIPPIALIFSPQEAAAMHVIMEIPVIAALLPRAARASSRPVVMPMLLALIAATPFGAYILYIVDADVMRVAISIVVLGMVALIALQRGLRFEVSSGKAAAAGLIGGLFQGATGMGGPPVVTALLSRRDPDALTRANIFTVMSSMILVSFAAFWWFGFLTPKTMIIGALAAPFCLAGSWLGSRSFKGQGGSYFQSATLAALTVLALTTLVLSQA